MANNGIYGSSQTNPYPQSPFLNDVTKRPSTAWQQFFLNLVNFSSSSSANTSTSGITVPANPVGYINITVNGQPFKVPYYNP
jgi:hypothetical protein